jgi:HSP20 family protein
MGTVNRDTSSDRTSAPSKSQSQQQSRDTSLTRRDPSWGLDSPFSGLFRRWNEEMDRLFEDVGFGPSWMTSTRSTQQWVPDVEVFHKGNDFVVRADLPGMKKEDVHVDIADNMLTIQGERKHEHEEEHDGWCRTERSYGSFSRAIPLPDGAIPDSAKANFKDGVLEITLQAPSREVSRGRRVDIS